MPVPPPRRAAPRAAAPLPPPTPEERAGARAAAAALRAALADPSSMGRRAVVHVDLCRPRDCAWFDVWGGLPGFARERRAGGPSYTHALLPGWEYTRAEVVSEMIGDLEALAERGARPTVATRATPPPPARGRR